MKNASKFMIIFMSAAVVQACENNEGGKPVRPNDGIPYVESVDESAPGSRVTSFRDPNTSKGADGSKLHKHREHITDADRKLLAELAEQREKESTK